MSVPCSAPRMVSRKAELDVLTAALDSAAHGEPQTVIVRGEAGIGKTRLIHEFLAQVAARDTRDAPVVVAMGQCVDLGPIGAPFTPIRRVLEDVYAGVGDAEFRAAAGGAGTLATIAALVPDVASEEHSSDTSVGPSAVAEAIERIIERLSRDHHLILVIEDLHWADSATLALLHTLAVTLRATRLTLILSYRTDDVGRGHPLRAVLAELERSRSVTVASVERLDASGIADQVAQILGRDPIPEEIDAIIARSEGVPFFVEELLDLPSGMLPDTLRDIILARYDRLTGPAKTVVKLASVAGNRVDHDTLAHVWTESDDALLDALRDAIGAHMLVADNAGYAFRHALLQEAVYDELLPSERSAAHRGLAAFLQARVDGGSPEHAASAAEHWLESRDDIRAFDATVIARHEARSAFALETCARLGERLLDLWPRVPEAARRAGTTEASLTVEIAQDYLKAGKSRAVIRFVESALPTVPSEAVLDRARLHHSAMIAASATDGCSNGVNHLDEVESLLATVDSPEAVPLRVRALAMRATVVTDPARRLDLIGQAKTLAQQTDDSEAIAYAHLRHSTVLAWAGLNEDALEEVRRALAVAGPTSGSGLTATTNIVDMMLIMGRYEEAIPIAVAGVETAISVGAERSYGAFLHVNLAEALVARGEMSQGLAHARRATALTRGERGRWVCLSLAVEAGARLWNDEVQAYLAIAADAAPIVAGLELSVETQADWARLAVDALVAHASDARPAEARDLLTSAAGRAGILMGDEALAVPLYLRNLLVSTARALGCLRRAGGSPDASMLARVSDLVADYPAHDPNEPHRAIAMAHLATATGAPDELERWRTAQAIVDRGFVTRALAHDTSYRLALALLDHDGRDEAMTLLRRITRDAPGEGVTLVSRWARAALSPDRRGGSVGPLAELTPRESEVLSLVAKGLTNGEIGKQLFISTKTASVHVSAILAKLGASNRAEAASLYTAATGAVA